jgi:hypothetical protein
MNVIFFCDMFFWNSNNFIFLFSLNLELLNERLNDDSIEIDNQVTKIISECFLFKN